MDLDWDDDVCLCNLCDTQLAVAAGVCGEVDIGLFDLRDWRDGHVSWALLFQLVVTADGSFESAIVPKWGASTITFQNVFISRRPKDPADSANPKSNTRKTAKATPPAPIPFLTSSMSPDTYLAAPPAAEGENYTMFDVNLDEVEVTLSVMRWLDGKGLVKDARIKGVRGVVGESSCYFPTFA